MLVLLLAHPLQPPLCLDSQRVIELLVGEREIDLRQVLLEPVQQLLHLRELNLKEYVRCQCSCGLVATLHEVKARELF